MTDMNYKTKINSVFFQNTSLKTKVKKLKDRVDFLEVENTFLSKQNDGLDFPYSFFVGLAFGYALTYLKYAV